MSLLLASIGMATPAPPAWFIADSSLTSVGERRQQAARDTVIATLAEVFPEASAEALRGAVASGGDLTTIVDRLLAAQFADEDPSQSTVSASSSASTSASTSASASASDSACSSSSAKSSGPTLRRRVHFEPTTASLEQMEYAGYEERGASGAGSSDEAPTMNRLSDEELTEQSAD